MSVESKVAVIIPAWNAAELLPVALKSLREQTAAPHQVIVVDDGSTDGTVAVAEQHGATCLRQSHAGPGAARNRGIAETKADYVAFLDADDWYVPQKLERCVQHLQQLGAACVATDAWIVRDDRVEGRKNRRRAVPSVLTLECLLRGNPIICSSVVARREAVLAAGGFDENPDLIATEDYDLWLRMSQREPLSYIAEPSIFYRVHTGSLSANTRFLHGVDLILDRVARENEGQAHFQSLVRRRRADVRLDFAWDLIAQKRGREARQVIDEANRLHRTWKGLRMRLRSLISR